MGDYRATPEQWAQCEVWGAYDEHPMGCILELRARVEALEAVQQNEEADIVDYYAALSAQHQGGAVFHEGSKPTLVTRVAAAISQDGELINWPGARAAIREVAAWLHHAGLWEASDALEREAGR